MPLCNSKIKLYVGDTSADLALEALKHDPAATLITSQNYKDLVAGTYYVSLGDLDDLNQLGAVLRQTDEIYYHPPDVWSDGRIFASKMQQWTEDYLDVFSLDSTKKTSGYNMPNSDIDNISCLVDTRKSEQEQIWIMGCSISHGSGVERDQRYGNLLSKKIGLPASFLTLSGSSISWAADQLLRSDVRKGDKVFWGITSTSRFTFWHEDTKSVIGCTISDWVRCKHYLEHFITEKLFASPILIHQSVSAIMQVVNFCEKIGAQLVTPVLLRGTEHYIRHLPSFLMLAGLWGRDTQDSVPDIGNDGAHPGPQSHQFYADKIFDKYQTLYQEDNGFE